MEPGVQSFGMFHSHIFQEMHPVDAQESAARSFLLPTGDTSRGPGSVTSRRYGFLGWFRFHVSDGAAVSTGDGLGVTSSCL